jgi:hypothetical protein
MSSQWTPRRDAELLRLQKLGHSGTEIAAQLGTTKSAVIGRLNRLHGMVFRSEKARSKKQREAVQARRQAALRKERALIEAMQQKLRRGMTRDEAMARASDGGLSLQAIGVAIGISKQAVHKAVANGARGARGPRGLIRNPGSGAALFCGSTTW